MNICLHACVRVTCKPGAWGGQKALFPLELGLQTTMSHRVC